MVKRSLSHDAPRLHLTIRNYGGSVEHFHHFLLGFLVPLICHAKSTWQSPKYREVLIRSCGPMDGIIRQLKSGRFQMLDKNEHHNLGRGRPRLGMMMRGRAFGSGDMRFVDLRGYDYPVVYNARAFSAAWAGLCEILGEELDAARDRWESEFAPNAPKILAIDRGEADPFYLSASAEAKSAGIARRSIPNYRQVTEEISDRVGPLLSLKLEGMTLVDQVALFSTADVIIAQHGAALSNLIWAKPGTSVVEIMPKTMAKATQDVGFFSNLTQCLRIRHRFVWQEHDHAAVDPVTVRRAVDQVITPGPQRAMARGMNHGTA